MFLNLSDDMQIHLTLKEISILTALAYRPANSYTIALVCADDAHDIKPMSRGSLHPALARLERTSLIQRIDRTDPTPNPGKPRVVYTLTPTGRLILEQHLGSLSRLVKLARIRLKSA